ncbi:MAG: hypothetical protein E6Q36_05820 [Chryseobacterium sp.]|nr:MAG: hypothetical protein E6Q36_05820 [Chryseobacterium sp.]
MATPLNTIFSWFETGDFPTQVQFQASWSSFWHKDDSIPISQITGLTQVIEQMVSSEALQNHINDSNAHAGYLAKLDASNLTTSHVNNWKEKLGVGEIPANVALVDMGENQSVFNKEQITSICMLLENYVNSNGKIMSGMIEALGLTELIPVDEFTLQDFIANHSVYDFQINDIIAIPSSNPEQGYRLYFYNGGDKTSEDSYLVTGLSNVTIAMVQGLQAALDSKMNKPTASGNYYARHFLGQVSWAAINPASSYLLFWNGNDFIGSGIYTDGTKFGIGTTAPTEMLHLNNGRMRTKAMVFDENTETLPYQITHMNRAYYGSDLTGAKYKFMYQNYTDLHNLLIGMTDTQKTQIRNDLRLTGESFSTGTPRIDVLLLPFIDNTKNFIQYTTLVGLNLFVDNVTPNAYIKIKRIKDVSGTNLPTPEVYDVDSFTVLQNFPNNLNFGINWFTKPEGYYQVFVTHNGLTNASSPELIVKAGLTYSQFTGITNWQKTSGGDSSVSDTAISSGSQGTLYYSDNLISTTEVNAGFMVSFSLNNQLGNYGANFVGFWRCGLIGNGDNVFYGVQYYDGGGTGMLPNTTLAVRNDTFHIAYYNGVVYVIAEGNGKTYQQFNSTYNLYPKRFVFQLGGGGQGSISMQLLGKILLS